MTDSARRGPPNPRSGTTPIERYETVAAGFSTRLDGVPAARWKDPSPCDEWTARDVAVHVIRTHRGVLARLEGTEPEDVDAGGDLAALWKAATSGVVAALSDHGRAETVLGGMFGEQTFESLVDRLVTTDTLVHTWDLARATGQDERLDEEAMSRSGAVLKSLDEAIRRPGGFATKIEPAPEADAQTRFLNFCGRRP